MNELFIDLANHLEIGILVGFFLVVLFHNVKVRLDERVEPIENPVRVPRRDDPRR